MDLINDDFNIILFNKGKNKEYFKDCIHQIQKNNNCSIFFIGDDNTFIPDTVNFCNLHEIHSENIKKFKNINFYNYDSNPLWNTSMLRFFYIESLMQRYSLKNIFHFDNDVLLYDSLKDVFNVCKNSKKMWITPCNNFSIICGLFFIPDIQNVSLLNTRIINMINNNYEEIDSWQKYQGANEDFMINEMTILKYISDKESYFDFFPILPSGQFSENYEKFNMCFDPAPWGQYIGGTPNGNPPGFISKKTPIGECIENLTIKCKMENKKPFLEDIFGRRHKMFNLHIHSKELYKYI